MLSSQIAYMPGQIINPKMDLTLCEINLMAVFVPNFPQHGDPTNLASPRPLDDI
jgi:hypothetical protein